MPVNDPFDRFHRCLYFRRIADGLIYRLLYFFEHIVDSGVIDGHRGKFRVFLAKLHCQLLVLIFDSLPFHEFILFLLILLFKSKSSPFKDSVNDINQTSQSRKNSQNEPPRVRPMTEYFNVSCHQDLTGVVRK